MKAALILALLTLTTIACGGSRDQPAPDANQKNTAGATAGGNPDSPSVAPVSIQALLALLPEPFDWQREKPGGERMTTPVALASASVRMMKGDATVTAKITDSALNQTLIAPFESALAGDFTRKTDNGYEKSIAIGDARGIERWDSATRTGNLTIVVARRFIVEIDGSTIESPKVLHDILEKINLTKLADLK
jgi:hypothetical protein